MISGYTQADQCREAFALFTEMQVAEAELNDVDHGQCELVLS